MMAWIGGTNTGVMILNCPLVGRRSITLLRDGTNLFDLLEKRMGGEGRYRMVLFICL